MRRQARGRRPRTIDHERLQDASQDQSQHQSTYGFYASRNTSVYWVAEVDGDDIEFVLAPPRSTSWPTLQSEYLGEHVMWVLDFDRVKHMSMDAAGLEQARAAFFRNDAYYPRPGGTEAADDELWEAFKARFLKTSLEKLGNGSPRWDLAHTLMGMIEQEGYNRRARREELEKRDAIAEQS